MTISKDKINGFLVKISYEDRHGYGTTCYTYQDIICFLRNMEGMGKQAVNHCFHPSIVFAVECAIRTFYFDNISRAFMDSHLAWHKCESYEEHERTVDGIKYMVTLYTHLNTSFT